MAGMPRDLPKYVYPERFRGKTRLVFRKGSGKRTAMPDIKSKKFDSVYAKCLLEEKVELPAIGGTLKWLVEQYTDSGPFLRYAKNTRDNRKNQLMSSVKKSPNAKVADITTKHIISAMNDRTPAMANNYLKAVRGMFKWAVKMEIVSSDPTLGIKKLTYKAKEQPVWEDADLAKYRAYWPAGSNQRLAVDLMYYCGLSLIDVVKLGRIHIKGGMIEIERTKTGVIQYIPINTELKRVIDSVPRENLIFLITKQGKPFTENGLSNFVLKARREAELGQYCQAHGLRRKRAVDLAEAGNTASELMSQFGWTDIKEAELYTQKADKRKMAFAGSKKVQKTPT